MIFRAVPPSRLQRIESSLFQRFLLVAGIAVLSGASGCVVAPVQPRAVVVVPQRVLVQVEPSYASPGVGWVWVSHPRHGWGWRHPSRGWHRGWR